jgi:hypothetical protein
MVAWADWGSSQNSELELCSSSFFICFCLAGKSKTHLDLGYLAAHFFQGSFYFIVIHRAKILSISLEAIVYTGYKPMSKF